MSCKKDNALDCFKSNGKDVTETRITEAFNTIKINNKIDVTIFKGSAYRLDVIAGEHIIKKISTKVKGGELNIENNNSCNFVRGYKKTIHVNITVPYIKSVFNDGVGTIRFSDDFQQDTLLVKAGSSGDVYINGNYNQIRTSSHGNGDLYLSGSCHSLFIYTNGINYVWAGDLKVTDDVFVETYTIGDCYIDARNLQKFAYNIHKAGNIYYKGTPGDIVDVSAVGHKGRAIQQ